MDKEMLKAFETAIEEGLKKCLKDNPGIEYKVEWFTQKADYNARTSTPIQVQDSE